MSIIRRYSKCARRTISANQDNVCSHVALALVFVHLSLSLTYPHEGWITIIAFDAMLAVGLIPTVRHAYACRGITAFKWWLVFMAMLFWISGFSANLYGEIFWKDAPVRPWAHDAFYLYRDLALLWVVCCTNERRSKISTALDLVQVVLLGMLVQAWFFPNSMPWNKKHIPDISDGTAAILNYSASIMIAGLAAIRVYVARIKEEVLLYRTLTVVFFSYGILSILIDWFAQNPNIPQGSAVYLCCDLPGLLFILLIAGNRFQAHRFLIQPSSIVRGLISSANASAFPMAVLIMGFAAVKEGHNAFLVTVISCLSICSYVFRLLVIQLMYRKQAVLYRQEKGRFEKLAHFDAVVGIFNRRWFDETLFVECMNADREGSHIAVLMIDVDNFKGYNDTLGHKAGDHCLRTVAQALRRPLLRANDALARYGGDEMAVILPHNDLEGASIIAEEMRLSVWNLKMPHPENPHGRVTVSIGVSATVNRRMMVFPAAMISTADAALYESKACGRNVVRTIPIGRIRTSPAYKA